jgi:hypothetical protein
MNRTRAKIGTFYSLQFLASKKQRTQKGKNTKTVAKTLKHDRYLVGYEALVILIYFHLNICQKT